MQCVWCYSVSPPPNYAKFAFTNVLRSSKAAKPPSSASPTFWLIWFRRKKPPRNAFAQKNGADMVVVLIVFGRECNTLQPQLRNAQHPRLHHRQQAHLWNQMTSSCNLFCYIFSIPDFNSSTKTSITWSCDSLYHPRTSQDDQYHMHKKKLKNPVGVFISWRLTWKSFHSIRYW